MRYIGRTPSEYTAYAEHICTAGANQTTFTQDDDGNPLNYDANFVEVHVNGLKLVNGQDYTATSGSSVTILANIGQGDVVSVTSFNSAEYTEYTLDNPASGDRSNRIATTEWVQNNATRPHIDKITNSGWNQMYILTEGVAYTINGNAGLNNYTAGNLGTNYGDSWGLNKASPIHFDTDYKVADIDIISNYAYAIMENGDLFMWGYNNYGQCGTGNTTQVQYPTLVAGPSLNESPVVEVYKLGNKSTGDPNYGFTHIRRADGTIWATGYNGYGQLGPIVSGGTHNTTNRSTFTPLYVPGSTDLLTSPLFFASRGARYGNCVFQDQNGDVHMFGYNGHGPFGNGGTTSGAAVQQNQWINNSYDWVIQGTLGGCGYTSDTHYSYGNLGLWIKHTGTGLSQVKTSGYNASGFIGDTTTTQRTNPYTISITKNGSSTQSFYAKDIDSVSSSIPCNRILDEDGVLWTWGRNSVGQCGVGNTTNPVGQPTRVSGPNGELSSDADTGYVKELMLKSYCPYSYSYHNANIVRLTNERIYYTGYNPDGQWGGGSNTGTTNRSHFGEVLIPRFERVRLMGHGHSSTNNNSYFVVTDNNTIYGWGSNTEEFIMEAESSQDIYVPKLLNIRRAR